MKHLKLFSAIMLAFVLLTTVNSAHAQIQKINVGAFRVFAMGTPIDHYAPKIVANFLPNIALVTKHSYHNAVYDIIGNQAITIHGFVYNAKEDIYLVLGKNAGKRGGTLGLGWECELSGGKFPMYVYAQYNTDWTHLKDLKGHFFSTGIIWPMKFTAWKRKVKV